MTITNKLNLPFGLVKAVSPEPHNKPGEISATTQTEGENDFTEIEASWQKKKSQN